MRPHSANGSVSFKTLGPDFMKSLLSPDVFPFSRLSRWRSLPGFVFLGLLAMFSAEGIEPDAAGATGAGSQPAGMVLTWKTDPCRSMVIDWHVPVGEKMPGLRYRERGKKSEWKQAKTIEFPFPHAELMVSRAELEGLEPDTQYEFAFGTEGRIYFFRTMPAKLERPVRFAIGGDSMHAPDWFEKTSRVAVSHDPDFAVIGGDLWYENGKASEARRVIAFFEGYQRAFVREDGRVVPLIVCIGNHEVAGGSLLAAVADFIQTHKLADPKTEPDKFRQLLAPYFYGLMAFPGQPGYGVLDFGNYLSLFLLDTDHTNPIAGAQSQWLGRELAGRSAVTHRVPVYHVPAYPSNRDFEGETSRKVREHWVPLFEANGVRVAFENHDHTYKRTPPIRRQKIDPDGIVFLGDGAWGVEPRPFHPVADTWYLEKAESRRHVMIVEVLESALEGRVYDEEGQLLDSWKVPASSR